MSRENNLYSAIGIGTKKFKIDRDFSAASAVTLENLRFYNNKNVLPLGDDLKKICTTSGLTHTAIKLSMGIIDPELLAAIKKNSDVIEKLVQIPPLKNSKPNLIKPEFETRLGKMYRADCLDFLSTQNDNTFDLIFADPPFNLNKLYPSKMDDNLREEVYLKWCHSWIKECIRTLKNGGTMLIWNLPKWNFHLAKFASNYASFRNWIGVDIKYSLPIQGRLYPSHYALLAFVKNEKPRTFKPDRLSMQTCPKCFHEIKDYGGYKSKMNPLGISLTDIWYDIPPVRHAKYKRRENSNELSIKLLDRIIEMSSNEGDLIYDPFGGSGTTYVTAELKNRRWVGTETGPIDEIAHRFKIIEKEREILNEYRKNTNKLFPEIIYEKRKKLGIWTSDDFLNKNP